MGLNPRRGDIAWVRLDPTQGSEIAKTRPCVVLSSDALNQWRKTVVVVPLSTSPKPNPPLAVPVRFGNRDSVAIPDQIRAVSKERLERVAFHLTASEMEAVEQAVRDVLDL